MYELWYDCQYNAKLCYVDRDSFIIYINTENVYEDIANYVEKKFLRQQIMQLKDHYQKKEIKM